jgi:Mn2+/Fe2+ NRAMP family transporter
VQPVEQKRRLGIRCYVRSIAPELVAGASDNDPTNVGTAIAVGAATVYRLAWVAILVAPLLGTIQTIAAEVGTAAGNDIQSLARLRYGRFVSAVLLASILPVNIVTIAADLLAGAAGIGQLTGVHSRWLVLPLGLTVVVLLMVGRYEHVLRVLRYLLLGFLAFGVTAVLARPQWSAVAAASFVPRLPLHHRVVTGALALLGTTLTSYVYVWETVGRGVEEASLEGGRPSISRVRAGAVMGAGFTALVLWFILIASAATIGRDPTNTVSILTAAQVLRPIAGSAAADLFAIGLVISALASLPVLLATTAFVVSGHFGWRRGLSDALISSPRFYGVVLASTGIALLVTCLHVGVITMLVAASLIAGIGAPFALTILILLARDPQVMHDRPISKRLAVAGWLVAVIVGALGLLYTA